MIIYILSFKIYIYIYLEAECTWISRRLKIWRGRHKTMYSAITKMLSCYVAWCSHRCVFATKLAAVSQLTPLCRETQSLGQQMCCVLKNVQVAMLLWCVMDNVLTRAKLMLCFWVAKYERNYKFKTWIMNG